MRALSARQAANCEKAVAPRCRCRCGGVAHGARRMVEAEREFFEQLPVDDPHWLPEKARQLRLPPKLLPQGATTGPAVTVSGGFVPNSVTVASATLESEVRNWWE